MSIFREFFKTQSDQKLHQCTEWIAKRTKLHQIFKISPGDSIFP